MSTMPIPCSQESSLLYNLYQELPIGVALLGSRMKVFSANRKFRTYFPFHPDGPNGLLLCNAIGCQYTQSDNFDDNESCKDCSILKSIGNMMRDNIPMKEIEVQYDLIDQCHLGTRWFRVNGIPAVCSSERYVILLFDDITSHIRKERSLKKKLELDLPTKVLNKYGLMKYYKLLLQADAAKPFTACMIDFDNFKKVNDQYGHLMGDKVLCQFSEIARKNIRTDDALGRYGGDEFLFVFPGIGINQAKSIVDRIQSELRRSFCDLLPSPVTFSAGLIFIEAGISPPLWNSLIETLDKLLYRAKAEGKKKNNNGSRR